MDVQYEVDFHFNQCILVCDAEILDDCSTNIIICYYKICFACAHIVDGRHFIPITILSFCYRRPFTLAAAVKSVADVSSVERASSPKKQVDMH